MEVKEIINKFCQIEHEIYFYYKHLFNLDVQNKKDSGEYNNCVDSLFLVIEEEKKYLALFASDLILLSEFVKLVNPLAEKSALDFKENLVLLKEQNKLIQARIYKRLMDIVLSEPEFFDKSITIGVRILMQNEDSESGLAYLKDIFPTLDFCTFKYLISLLHEELDKTNKPSTKQYLLESIYNISFIWPDLERIILKNNFNKLANTFDQDINVVNNTISSETKTALNTYYGECLYTNLIYALADVDNKTIATPGKQEECLLLLSLLKVSLLFADVNKLDYLKNSSGIDSTSIAQMPDHQAILIAISSAFDTLDQTIKKVNNDLDKQKKDTIN